MHTRRHDNLNFIMEPLVKNAGKEHHVQKVKSMLKLAWVCSWSLRRWKSCLDGAALSTMLHGILHSCLVNLTAARAVACTQPQPRERAVATDGAVHRAARFRRRMERREAHAGPPPHSSARPTTSRWFPVSFFGGVPVSPLFVLQRFHVAAIFSSLTPALCC